MDDLPDEEAGTTGELAPQLGGRWMVDTGNSVHVWDLDRRTYTRQPGPTAGALAFDNVEVPIARVEIWPKLGTRFFLWVDDPADPLTEHWRVSSPVVAITRQHGRRDRPHPR